MAETFGEVLKYLREAKGLTVDRLAAHSYCTGAAISYVENGKRDPSPRFVEAVDRALGSAPLLAFLWAIDVNGQGDTMERRTLVAGLIGAAGMGGLGLAVFSEQVRGGLLDAVGADEDWDTVLANYGRRMVTDPSAEFGEALLAQTLIAQRLIVEMGATPDRLRAVAHLGQLYGLFLGNQGNVAAARGWYGTAAHLADRSNDKATMVFVRARTANRGIYEGYTVRETVDGAQEALSLSAVPCAGGVEAQAALVHVHGLSGNLAAGRAAVLGMRSIAERLPDADRPDGAVARTVSFRNYLECRVGPRAEADAAFAEAERALRPVTVWMVDAQLYYGLALVRDGDIAGGVSYALGAIRTLGADVRVLAVGVSDVIAAVPAGYRSDELDELRTFAAPGRMPWATIGA